MKKYIEIVKHVLANGREKRPVRRNFDGDWEPVDGGVMTLACPNVLFSHDMKDGFPLLTTKKMAFKTLCVELEGFIKGITNKEWYQDRKCKIWDEWANPEVVKLKFDYVMETTPYVYCGVRYENELELKKAIQKTQYDLGPIYGYQWRKFDQDRKEGYSETPANGVSEGADQLKNIVDTLKTNPMDRRMVCSAWNPNQMDMMGLPPCHYAWNVTVIGDELNLFWAQRSCDLMLGVPFNIASYGLLLSLLAEVGGFKRGNLSGMLVDCHIYENQIEAAEEQVKRDPRPLPEIYITQEGRIINSTMEFDIFNWEYDDILIENYEPHNKIDFGGVVV